MTSYQVKIAAEAFAAGFFAHADCDVSVQYGANQPIYDLIAARPPKLVGVSVKGSQDGSWGLTQSHLVAANYASAIDTWLARHAEVLFCFVQFNRVAVGNDATGYDDLGKLLPSRRDPAKAPNPPAGWPADPIHFVDSGPDHTGLDVGWYAYRAYAIDLYGRFSPDSNAIPWMDQDKSPWTAFDAIPSRGHHTASAARRRARLDSR